MSRKVSWFFVVTIWFLLDSARVVFFDAPLLVQVSGTISAACGGAAMLILHWCANKSDGGATQ